MNKVFKIILLGLLVVLFFGCSKPKIESIHFDNISNYENIMEEFDKKIGSLNQSKFLSLHTLPIENQTKNKKIINKIKFIPEIELAKLKNVNSKGISSDETISCSLVEADSLVNCYILRSNEEMKRDSHGAMKCDSRKCYFSGGIRNYEDRITINCKLGKISTANQLIITRKNKQNKTSFKFSGTGITQGSSLIESRKNDGVDRALNLLVDISLIELISKAKGYNYRSKLRDFQHEGIGYEISANSPKVFSVDENISFRIDTKNRKGYIYIFYIDSNRELTQLYPNSQAPILERSGGVYTFPKDFGDIKIQAKKNCSSCEKESAKIYVLHSKSPIPDSEEITVNQILNIPSHPIPLEPIFDIKIEYNLNVTIVKFDVQ